MARLLLIQPLFVEQFGVMSLAAVAKAQGHQVAVAIGADDGVLARAEHFQPNVIGFSVMTGYQRRYLALAKRLKQSIQPSPLVIFGGPHPTFFPNVVLESGVDVICRGEGEGALEEILAAVDKRKPFDPIQNLALNESGQSKPCRCVPSSTWTPCLFPIARSIQIILSYAMHEWQRSWPAAGALTPARSASTAKW